MIETIDVNVDGLKFSIQQFTARQALRLEKKTITVLSPVLKVLSDDNVKSIKKNKKSSLDQDIDISKIANVIQEILQNFSDDDFENYVFKMFENVICYEEGSTPTQMTSEIFDRIFVGKNITIYKLLIEVMKANKFSFFGLMGGGLLSKISG